MKTTKSKIKKSEISKEVVASLAMENLIMKPDEISKLQAKLDTPETIQNAINELVKQYAHN